MKFKRTVSIMLASAFIINSASGIIFAAAPLAGNEISLSYIKSDENDPKTATIVLGNSTTIKEQKPSGYTQSNPPFTVKTVGLEGIDPSSYIKFKDNNLIGTKDVAAEAMPNGKEEQTYSISGNYYAIKAEGDAYESLAGWGTSHLTTIKSLTPNAVMEYSEATIECIQEETETTPPAFSFKADTSKSGVFKDFANINVKSSTKIFNKPKIVVFQLENGNDVKEFEIYPMQTHIEYQTDGSGNFLLDPNGNKIEKGRNNYIKKGTTFRMVFRLSSSNELFLRVLTPQRATNNIAEEILRNDGVINKSYIQLGTGDTLNFITQNFKLNSLVNQYGTFFNIEWAWEPADPEDKHVVSIASSGTLRDVALNPKQTDVEGKLKAKVYYKKGQGPASEVISNIPIEIPILIRGTGTPASVEQFSEIIGGNPENKFTDTALPSLKLMDIYDGTVLNYDQPKNPYKYKLRMYMGKLNASSQYAVVEAVQGSSDVISIQTIINNTPADYKIGDKIDNPVKNNVEDTGIVDLDITARKVGEVKLQVSFYVKGNKGQIVKAAVQPKPFTIRVEDTSPSDDSSLGELVLYDQDNKQISFGFNTTKKDYDITVPFAISEVKIKPTRKDPYAKKDIAIKIYDQQNGFTEDTVESGRTYQNSLSLVPNVPNKIQLIVTAQNPNVKSTYTLNIMRLPPSDDGTLKSLKLTSEGGVNYMTGFKPEVRGYEISVPYSASILKVEAVPNHPGVKEIAFMPELVNKGLFGKKEWLAVEYVKEPFDNLTDFTVTVTPEIAKQDTSQNFDVNYNVKITRQDPSSDAYLADLKVTDSLDKNLTYTPKFNKEIDTYELFIPFTTDKVKFSAKTTHEYATMTILRDGIEVAELTSKAPSKAIDVTSSSIDYPYQEFTILVTAEDGVTTRAYKLNITRAEPNHDPTLGSLKICDQAGKEVDYDFFTDRTDYYITVPYETQKVTFTPSASYPAVSEIKVDGRKVKNGETSQQIALSYPGDKKITVEITAEDGITKMQYSFTFTRTDPSSDARLKGLTLTGAENFRPIFIANKTAYTADVIVGAKGVNITATANHPDATIRIDGKKATSGSPSELITLLEIKQKVDVVVTAQDGKTTMTYTITFTNQNLIEKSSNADLKDLKINYGAMTPGFKSSVTTYEVAASEETYSVDIIPQPADSQATVQVFAGSKEIGDYYGNYSQAISDGDNPFLVRVTSPDETRVKEYSITVYRNEDDKMNTLKPIGPKDIDYESTNPIVVDITKYSRVSADVFNELTKYPGKQIIFQGNDYSLTFNASDFKTIIPHTMVYDFGLTFTSPLEDEIWDEIDSYSGNAYADVVFVYFKHHGQLPAKAKFSLSLGKKYKNKQLYWHYYNEERERIDYYGYFYTNSRGTFTIPLHHMSTYMSVDQRLAGSEDKSNLTGSANLGISDGGKLNPNTGAGGSCR